MSIYHGVIHNNTVVLEQGVQLHEGTEVEIHVSAQALSRDEAFARLFANRISHPVGIDEIIDEGKREREERADRWLQGRTDQTTAHEDLPEA